MKKMILLLVLVSCTHPSKQIHLNGDEQEIPKKKNLTKSERKNRKIIIDRAIFDFQCPKEDLTIHPLGYRTYGVSGCKKTATYVINCVLRQGLFGVREGECSALLNSNSK